MTDEAINATEGYLDRGRRQADSALEAARQYGSDLEDQISENPLTAVAVAIGIGCIVGYLLRGR